MLLSLAGIPLIIITVRYITNVLAYGDGRVLICRRTHLVLPIALLLLDVGDVRRGKEGVTR